MSGQVGRSLDLLEKITVHTSLLEECQLHGGDELGDKVASCHLHLVRAFTRGKKQTGIETMIKHTVTTLRCLRQQLNPAA